MHSRHINTKTPIVIPSHANGRPEWLCLRILLNAMIPKINAREPGTILEGKQMNPVNGIGSQPAQKKQQG